jgi:hypothetical protein
MRLSRKEKLACATIGALVVALAVALVLNSWAWSLGLLGALVLLVGAVIVLVLRRHTATLRGDLARIEQKIDHLALRVVTESQATHRELGGLIEELGTTLRQDD